MNTLRVDTIELTYAVRAPFTVKANWVRVWARVNQIGTLTLTSGFAVSSVNDWSVGTTAFNYTWPFTSATAYMGVAGGHKQVTWTATAEQIHAQTATVCYNQHAENGAALDTPNADIMLCGAPA
ncbi:MAG: hypothetical protein ABWY63_14175 [Hyphomicrobiaceae bacterium]